MKYYTLYKEGKLFDRNKVSFLFLEFGLWPTSTKSKITKQKLKSALFIANVPIWKTLNYKRMDSFSRAMRKIFPYCDKTLGESWQFYLRRKAKLDSTKVKPRHNYITQRTPSWVNKKSIKLFYEMCPKGYHVDHIIPLRGVNITGLHVLENLQYLPALENLKKGNRYD